MPLINGDPIQLEQVFLNIINNAEYFMAWESRKGILADFWQALRGFEAHSVRKFRCELKEVI